jgi:hypothetical protein
LHERCDLYQRIFARYDRAEERIPIAAGETG